MKGQKSRMETKFVENRQMLGYCLFLSDWQLKALSKCRIILSDGTFKLSPKYVLPNLEYLELFLEYLENQKFP